VSDLSSQHEDVFEEGGLQKRQDELLAITRELFDDQDLITLRLILNNQHESDLADLLAQLPEDDQPLAFDLIAAPLAANTLSEIETPTLLTLLEYLEDRLLSRYIEYMDPDDATDLLGKLPEDRMAAVMDLLADDTTETVEGLLPHADDTGGGIMTSRLVTLREEMTVEDAIQYLREWANEDEVFYLYVVDAEQHLIGTVPLRRLLLAPNTTRIHQLTQPDPLSVRPDMDQEEVAHIFADYNLLALPVVDQAGVLMGQITVDDIVDVIQDEATEDIYEMAAMSSEELEERSVVGVVKRRLPWLMVCLAGTLLSGGVIDVFSDSLKNMNLLVLFIPAIMAMGGNAGIQTSTVTVRNMAIGHIQAGSTFGVVLRELRVACMMGVLLGLLVYVVARVWIGDAIVAACVGTAMYAAIVLSAALGALVPIFFDKLGIDPAVASGPLITTLNDGLSLLLYFSISILFLTLWRPGFL
jgi:magnesium transporter